MRLSYVAMVMALCASVSFMACGKKKDKKAEVVDEEEETIEAFRVTGQLAVGTYGLTASNPVTHVIGFNPSTEVTAIAAVASDGSFELPFAESSAEGGLLACVDKAAKTADRDCAVAADPSVEAEIANMTPEELYEAIMEGEEKESEETADASAPSPWVFMYVNAAETGADMIVSRFGSNTLDTIAPAGDSTETLDMGEVSPVDGAAAEAGASYADVLTATGLSEGAAETLGAADTVVLRYINPDVDNNGTFDAEEEKKFILDFHNRFSWRTVAGNASISYTQLKNKFPEEVAANLADVAVTFGGTGIVPEMEKANFDAAPSTYRWKFDFSTGFAGPVELNNSDVCVAESSATTRTTGQWCTQDFTVDPNYERYQLGLEVKSPPEGTYTLEAGGKTFTWTNVEVSDFSAGEGFISIMYRLDASAGDALTGISYKLMKKTASGWELATQEEIDLLVDGKVRASFKFGGGNECGWNLDAKPEGSVVFASTDVDTACNANTSASIKSALESGTQPFSSLSQGPGISYDDKLGMRFFF